MAVLQSQLDTRSEQFRQNKEEMTVKLEQMDELYAEAARGGGAEALERLAKRNKMPIRERIAWALDPDSPFLEISPLAAWRSHVAIGSGFVVGVGVIEGVECVRVIGVRSLSREEQQAAREDDLSYIEAGWADLREHLSDIVDALDGPLYLSLDMDAIDPAFAPGVGTPEPFGMTPYEVLQVLNFLSDRLVGFDCVETCPPADNGNTAALAARLVRHALGAVVKAQTAGE